MYTLMRLKAPMQSWGNDTARFTDGGVRGTNPFPTYSGIIGLVASCMGINQKRNPEAYAELIERIDYVGSFAHKTFPIITDYQTMGGGYDTSDPIQKKMFPRTADGSIPVGKVNVQGISMSNLSIREYIEDADFFVVLRTEGDDYTERLVSRLKNPTWFPYYGRACCIPTTRLFVGQYETLNEAIDVVKGLHDVTRLIAYLSKKPDDKHSPIVQYDTPTTHAKFSYGKRTVYKTIV